MANDVDSYLLSGWSPRDPVLSLPPEDSLNMREKRNGNDIACAHTHTRLPRIKAASSHCSFGAVFHAHFPGGCCCFGYLLSISWGQVVRVPSCAAQLPLLIVFQTWHHLNPGEMRQRPERMKASRWPTAICPKAWDHLIDGAKYPAM